MTTFKLLADRSSHLFFGYYDHTPFNHDDTKLLAMRAACRNRMPRPSDLLDIVVYDLKNLDAEPRVIGQSETWCWQQGCRLRWFPGGSMISYNKLIKGEYGSVVQDSITGETTREFSLPLYDVAPDGKWGLSLDFSRLHRLRPGYGYVNLPDSSEGKAAPDNNGVWRLDMETGKKELLFSLADAASYELGGNAKDAQHYFNHISIAPDGKRFMFFHLWVDGSGRHNRMITCDADGRNWSVLNARGITSHYAWKDAETLLACVARLPEGLRFFEYKDQSDEFRMIGGDVLTCDGHPSYSRDKKLILLDTYPDKYAEQSLYLYDLSKSKVRNLVSAYSPFSFRSDLRCDLHPRWSNSGRYIAADLPLATGYRGLAVIDVEQGQNICDSQ